jgi:quercetin dioxygenase-like cupin family protein
MSAPTIKLELADSRGEIYSVLLPDGTEFMLLHSVAGSLRGGHSHDTPEAIMMFSGRMRYHKLSGERVLADGECSHNAKGEVHMGEFLEDSWLIERKIGVMAHEGETVDYAPYRDRVRAAIR